MSGRGGDFEMAKLQRTGLFAFGTAGFAIETESKSLLGDARMSRGDLNVSQGCRHRRALELQPDAVPDTHGERVCLLEQFHRLALT